MKQVHAILAVVALGAGMMLSGCESVYERAARLSCQWNHDINLKGCDRWDFARCIDNCEYCVGAPGSQFEGTSDECNQLKCGAYCAKQESDLKCLSTYKFLCEQGKKAFSDHHGQSCDVDCNPATKAQPRVFLVMSMVTLVLSKLPARALLVAGVLLTALHLQGCEENYRHKYAYQNTGSSASSSGGAFCAPETPLLPDWKPDFARLDEKAGCNNAWNWLWGNPCASEVPVIFAKKGLYDSDEQEILERVEVERYNCTKVTNGYCAEWTTFEKSCKEQDFGVCTCTEPSGNKKYCKAWSCVTKEAEQNLCWESCCGSESCSPCVKCGAFGSAPFPMNRQVYDELMAKEGVISNRSKEDDAGRRLDGYFYLSDTPSILGHFRSRYWMNYYFGGVCISSRDIHSPHEFPCNQWREIETEIQTCECLRPDAGDNFCGEWKCEEKDVGQFSILFTVDQNYENLLVGQEVEKYTCQQHQGVKCTGWRGEIESYEEVEVTQCRGCENVTAPHCASWYCDEYEMPKILHEDTVWPRRIGFAFLHFLWMFPAALFFSGFLAAGNEGCKDNFFAMAIGWICFSGCGALLFYAIGFLRWMNQEQSWYAPLLPLGGLGLTFCLACFLSTACLAITQPEDKEVGGIFLPMCTLGIIMLLGLLWVGGVALLLPFCGCAICALCALVVSSGGKSARGITYSRNVEEDGEDSKYAEEEEE